MECMTTSPRPPQLLERSLPDGALRRSAAAESQGTLLEPLKLGCPDFESKADVLRALVHMTLAHLLRAWESDSSKDVLLRHEAGHAFMSLSEAVSQAKHLEHFHTYTTPSKLTDEPAPSIELHTDAGLLLAFTAPLYSDGATFGSGLRTSEGEMQLPEDSLAFMVGEATQWLPWPSRPLAHALHLPRNSQRAWYGLMVRLPNDAVKATDFNPTSIQQHTFGEWWGNASAALASQRMPLGCGEGQFADMTVMCPEGKAFCWMQCMTLPPVCTQQTAQCLHKDGTPWSNHSEMCPTCTLSCPAFEGWDFCDHSAASDMVMTGFVTYGFRGDSMTPCVVLFFQSWVLSTPVKFWLGTLGVFIFSILVEGVAMLQLPGEYRKSKLLATMLYAVRMSMAYFIMLAAMTFSVEIFLAVVSGLSAGHYLFRVGRNVQAGISGPTLCCSHGAATPSRTPSEVRRDTARDTRVTPCLQADSCVVLSVGGMTCGSCTRTVKCALEEVAGVVSARVTLAPPGVGLGAPGLAEIWVNAGFPGVDAAVSAVEDVGFEATSSHSQQHRKAGEAPGEDA
eukprot:TRINITY_DN4232_c0_g2_i1.p1 TRINITY_DN4232_c0_g2~~TRINITY_DN4232_c0_g2_i1.p1  ORF type:complete len:642 (+),score=126.40 TRINITY_DN4232_c0_g2_i1:235-1926(+)